ncbi:ComC/BlpC family leader-containing pheromone/bacteriocin, partial [Streptococcus pneumoniae]
MDTKMMSQFAVMDNEMLARIEGGDVSDIYRGYANQV